MASTPSHTPAPARLTVPPHSDPRQQDDQDDDEDEDDSATIGLRTPRLSSTASLSPYAHPANNSSQHTIVPLPLPLPEQQHTYTSLGSHLALDSPAPTPTPQQQQAQLEPPPHSPPQPALLSKLHSFLTAHSPFSRSRPTPTPTPLPTTTKEKNLTSPALFALTLALAGAQLSWTLELAYGNLFLLSLGLSPAHSALVWLAGPLSGLVAQPLVGAWSDRLGEEGGGGGWRKYRRRSFLVGSALVVTLSTALLAFVKPAARFLVDAVLHVGEGDWDPDRIAAVDSTTKALAILAFWILDLALNGLQAAARALILDVAPRKQQSRANAWHGRMTHAGNVLGYAAGWLDLGSLSGLSWLGGGQFRKLAIVSVVGMLICVSITCIFTSESASSPPLPTDEPPRPDDIERPLPSTKSKKKGGKKNAPLALLAHITHATRTLPTPLARVCLVQLFAFSSWFPFLFFATTYVVELQRSAATASGEGGGGEGDRDTERGSAAMLLYALVAFGAGAGLPYLAIASSSSSPSQKKAVTPEENHGQTTETAGGTVIYTREDERPGSSPSMASSSAVLDEESDRPLGFTSFLEHERRHSSSERSLPDHDDEENDDDDEGETDALLTSSNPHTTNARTLLHSITLRTLWTLGSILTFLLLTLGTTAIPLLFPSDGEAQVRAAMGVVGLMGVPWAVACWVPFALLGEFLKEGEEERERVREGGGRRGGRDALVDCAPLSSGSASGSKSPSPSTSRLPSSPSARRLPSSPSSKSASRTRQTSGASSSSRRRQPSPSIILTSSDDEEEDEQQPEESGSGLRTLPTSEAYTRRLESDELRRATAGATGGGADTRRRAFGRGARSLEMDDEGQQPGGTQAESEEEEEEGRDDEGQGESERESERERERERDGKTSSSAGTILGIHNLAIVLPQFFVALIANLLFRLSPSNSSGIVWVLRFGGCMGLLAALATRWVPLTRTEREVKRLERRRRRRRGGKGRRVSAVGR